jgi:hypothetical protein
MSHKQINSYSKKEKKKAEEYITNLYSNILNTTEKKEED